MKRSRLLEKVTEGKLTLAAVTRPWGELSPGPNAEGEAVGGGARGLGPWQPGPGLLRSQLAQEVREQVCALSQERYREFNDSQFCEELAHCEGICG